MTEEKKNLSSEQEHAIDLCTDMDERIVGVTGGAGTGKTFVLGHVYKELRRKFGAGKIVLAAPTGRAAKRIKELTGIEAKTIHRLLEFPQPDDPIDENEPPPPNLPRRDRDHPLDQKVVIIDEASMVSTELYEMLTDALPRGGVIRMFGDNQQLAPVEDNSGLPPPFIDVLKSQPSVTLTYNFRSQDEIVGNALAILKGSMPSRNRRFEIIYSERPIEQLIEFVTDDFMNMDHQIIMPMRKNTSGTMRVNPSVQMRFNAKGPLLRLDRYADNEPPLAIRANDKFLWIKNDYQLALFNGEIGQVGWLDDESGEVGLVTSDREITVPGRMKFYNRFKKQWMTYDPRKQIELGYAITTHKSQGSEFDTVVYCMAKPQFYLLSRRNFYTAITRAKNRVILITDRASMGISLRKKD